MVSPHLTGHSIYQDFGKSIDLKKKYQVDISFTSYVIDAFNLIGLTKI